ncbi:peroxidase family protein [Amaricoccus sp.]|uniref:peroxidase family protein n=1 Tax=Amaricoccus sp. TaxID=1872485 RepID=UPI001B429A74|nr:peroxidase family protein [Amaricoccus sp.]MBP7001873.1 hypothetical protein [Amaricoccus sp.]
MSVYEGYYKYQDYYGSYLDWLDTLEARDPSGHGNNLAHDDWGAAHSYFLRATENSYPDAQGFTNWHLPVQRTNGPPFNGPFNVGDMPQPRAISDAIHAQDTDIPSAVGLNQYFQFFGQYLTHDFAEAALVGPAVPADPIDPAPLFVDGLPFPFARTPQKYIDDDNDPNTADVAVHVDQDGDGVIERNQPNDETSYLDLSQTYGSSQGIEHLLRANAPGGGKSAKLLMGASDNLLPTYQEVADHHGLAVNDVIAVLDGNAFGVSPSSFAAGDNRANQQTHLLSQQLLWARNHNWHVDQLEAKYPTWTQEQLFEAARALNEAEWQHIVYAEYMPKLIGAQALSAYSGYHADVDATVINEFTTVAFRFAHSASPQIMPILDEDGSVATIVTTDASNPTVTGPLNLGLAFQLGANGVRNNDAVDAIVRGQLTGLEQEIDRFVVDGNRNALFGPAVNGDLTVFDIQRARDHGVGLYNKLRDGLGLDTYDDFDDFGADNNVDAATLLKLKQLYNTGADGDGDGVKDVDGIDRLDSLIGGLLEKDAPGSQLGEMMTILNVMQFENFRDGDRLFYLNRFKDHPDLIKMIESSSLSDVVARNTTIDHVYRDAFVSSTRIGGTDGNNSNINGTNGLDLLIGFKGNDKLYGKKGADDIYGDDGNDQAWGGAGNDMIWGGKGKDKLYGEADHDYLDGGDGNDELRGAAGDDFLFGGKGKDKLYGSKGYDYLDGGEGNDQLRGEQGRDVFAFGKNAGDDTVYDFTKSDKLDLSALDFFTVQDVREASHRSGSHTIIDLDDYGASVRLMNVGWKLGSAQLILADDGDYYI